MRKFVLFCVGVLLSTAMYAQMNISWYHVYGSAVFKGGYNVLEKAPVAVIDLNADIGFLRTEFEIGYSPFQTPTGGLRRVSYFAPSFGVMYGNKNMVYLLVGGQPWGGVHTSQEGEEKILNNYWHLKFESGVDFRISDLFYFNVSGVYLLPRKDDARVQHFQNLSFLAGLGINF